MKTFYRYWRKGLCFPVIFFASFTTAQVFTMPMEIFALFILVIIFVSFELFAWKKGWHDE